MSEEECIEPDKYDCMSQDDPVCPYCGHEELDSWEISSDTDGITCNACRKDYAIEQETYRRFSSSKTCQPGDVHPFDEWRGYGNGLETRYCTICHKRELRGKESPARADEQKEK